MRLFVEGIGLRCDGLESWAHGKRILCGAEPYSAAEMKLPNCALLPPAERRRAVPSVNLALSVASEAADGTCYDVSALETIFTSSAGDNETLHEILQMLATPERQVSPTRFHNSVHNAPAGYWHIATNSREASTSIACHDASFAAGLLDAASRAVTGNKPMLLVTYDLPYLGPLAAVRALSCGFGAALLLAPQESRQTLASIEISLCSASRQASCMNDLALESMREGNPAARSLPLLAALARGVPEKLVLRYVGDYALAINLTPAVNVLEAADGRTPQSLGDR